MAVLNLRIEIGHVDLTALTTDEDFAREAKRLLPGVLNRIGEEAGRVAWEKTQAAFKGVSGLKMNSSSSDKSQFIREAGDNYRRGLGAADRRNLEERIIATLKERKGACSSSLPEGAPPVERKPGDARPLPYRTVSLVNETDFSLHGMPRASDDPA